MSELVTNQEHTGGTRTFSRHTREEVLALIRLTSNAGAQRNKWCCLVYCRNDVEATTFAAIIHRNVFADYTSMHWDGGSLSVNVQCMSVGGADRVRQAIGFFMAHGVDEHGALFQSEQNKVVTK